MTSTLFKTFTIPRIEMIDGKKNPIFTVNWQKDLELILKEQDYFNKKDHKISCVMTGKINGITVIDCDTDKAYYDLVEKYPYLKDTLTVKTPKGFHIYGNYNEYFETTVNKDIDIDVRNDKGLVFGIGSVREDGLKYEILKDLPRIDLTNDIFDDIKPNNNKDMNHKKFKIVKTPDNADEPTNNDNIIVNDKYLDLLFYVIKNEKNNKGNWIIDFTLWMKICWILKSCDYSRKVFEKFNIEQSNKDRGNELWDRTNAPHNKDIIYALQNMAKEINPHGYKDWLIKHNEYFHLGILDKGENDIANFISKFISQDVVFCKNEWYFCDNKTNLWKKTKEPSAIITTYIQKKINESLTCVLIKLDKCDNEEEKKKLENQKEKYNKHYTTVCKSSVCSQIIKYLKTYLTNDEFDEKLDISLYKIAYKNGTLDLKTMIFKSGFEKTDFITKTILFDYEKPTEKDIEFVRENL